MAFCNKCGAQLADGSSFCPACGAQTNAAPAQNTASANEGFKGFINKLLDTPDHTSSYDATDIENNKIMALLSYIGLLFLVPLFAAKDSRYAQFHVNQGIVFCIASIAFAIIQGILFGIGFAFFAFIPFLGLVLGVLIWILQFVLSIPFILLMILGIYNSVQGKAQELPIIGKYRILK